MEQRGETLGSPAEFIDLRDMLPGKVVNITTGVGETAWQHRFEVMGWSHCPTGTLTSTSPSGEQFGPLTLELHGSTDDDELDPAQYRGLRLGAFMQGRPCKLDDVMRPGTVVVYNQPGLSISHVEIEDS